MNVSSRLVSKYYNELYCSYFKDMATQILEKDSNIGENDFCTLVTLVESLWKDKGVRECFQNRNLYQLPDSTR